MTNVNDGIKKMAEDLRNASPDKKFTRGILKRPNVCEYCAEGILLATVLDPKEFEGARALGVFENNGDLLKMHERYGVDFLGKFDPSFREKLNEYISERFPRSAETKIMHRDYSHFKYQTTNMQDLITTMNDYYAKDFGDVANVLEDLVSKFDFDKQKRLPFSYRR